MLANDYLKQSKEQKKSPYFFLSWDNGKREKRLLGRAVMDQLTYFNLNQL